MPRTPACARSSSAAARAPSAACAASALAAESTPSAWERAASSGRVGLRPGGGKDAVGLGPGSLQGGLGLRADACRGGLGLGPGGGEDAVGLCARLRVQRLGALARRSERCGRFRLGGRQALALLRKFLLGLHELLPRALELALEVIELRLALVERQPAEPDLLLGARQPVLGRLLRVPFDAVGELDRRPDELESLEPCRAVVCGEARAAAEIGAVRVGREPFELRERNDVGAGLRFVLQELAFVPLNRIHGFLFRAAQA